MEIWVRTNPRPFIAALMAPVATAALGGALIWSGWSVAGVPWRVVVGSALILAGLSLALLLLWRARLPLLARNGDELLLYLGGASPIAIPLEIVECFFAGQGDSLLRDRAGKELESSMIILRIAESAKEWHHRDVPVRFAHWCEGYITLRGAWCEPIGPDLLRRLNQRLSASQREQKAKKS